MESTKTYPGSFKAITDLLSIGENKQAGTKMIEAPMFPAPIPEEGALVEPLETVDEDVVLETSERRRSIQTHSKALDNTGHSFDGLEVLAIDSTAIQLGVIPAIGGLLIALRAAVVIQRSPNYSLVLTDPVFELITASNRDKKLEYIGDFFETPRKYRNSWGGYQLIHVFRNFLERVVQTEAINLIQNGILLFDGTLTMETHTTSKPFFEKRVLPALQATKNSIVAVSKSSNLRTSDGFLAVDIFYDVPGPRYYQFSASELKNQDTRRLLGSVFVSKFSEFGHTYRVDVFGNTRGDEEALQLFYDNSLMIEGYPDLLRLAHVFAYPLKSDVIQWQVQAAEHFGYPISQEPNPREVFGPFGGRSQTWN